MLDFESGTSFPSKMDQAFSNSRRLIPLYSPTYWGSSYCKEELNVYWQRRQKNPNERFLLPLVVVACDVPERFETLLYESLVEKDRNTTMLTVKKLLEGIGPSRPSAVRRSDRNQEPVFPGLDSSITKPDEFTNLVVRPIPGRGNQKQTKKSPVILGLASSVGVIIVLLVIFVMTSVPADKRTPGVISTPTGPDDSTKGSSPAFTVPLKTLIIDKSLPPGELLAVMEFQRTSLQTAEPNFELLVLEVELEPDTSYEVTLVDGSRFPPMLLWISSGNALVMSDSGTVGSDRLAVVENQSEPVILHVAGSDEITRQLVKCYLKFYYDPIQRPAPFSGSEVTVSRLAAVSGG